MSNIVCNPVGDAWPGKRRVRHDRSRFDATWTQTRKLLERELDQLGARKVVLHIDLEQGALRQDGWPKSMARFISPAVMLTFDSRKGEPMQFYTDLYDDWHDNTRAIALALEALRKIDRYAVNEGHEQYTGFQALPPGGAIVAEAPMSMVDAIAFLREHAHPTEWDYDDPESVNAAYRFAAKRLHPDAGGDAELFKRLQRAIETIGASDV